ncbi:MAG: Vmh family MBL fold metallo-hydrolase [Marinomonas gallaica]
MTKLSTLSLLSAAIIAGTAHAADLQLTTYNAGPDAIFPVTSVLVTGEKDAILFDAQFSVSDGQELVKLIKASNKHLRAIYISGGDPDFYFGLEPILAQFPDVEVIASESVVEHINDTKDAKLDYWGPILGDNSPSKIFTPTVMNENSLTLEGQTIELKELGTHQAYAWIPSTKTVFGGVSVSSGMHVWTADTQTKEARAQWQASLENMKQLQPTTVVPGHYLGDIPKGEQAIDFTLNYLKSFEKALQQNDTSEAVINALTTEYPELPGLDDLALSAKVNTGEMAW